MDHQPDEVVAAIGFQYQVTKGSKLSIDGSESTGVVNEVVVCTALGGVFALRSDDPEMQWSPLPPVPGTAIYNHVVEIQRQQRVKLAKEEQGIE